MSFGSSCPPSLTESSGDFRCFSTSLIPLIYPIETFHTFQMFLLRIRLRIFETDVYTHTHTHKKSLQLFPPRVPFTQMVHHEVTNPHGPFAQVACSKWIFSWRHLGGYQQKQEITRVFTPRRSRHSCSLPNVRLHVTPTASFGTCHKCRGGRSSPDCTEAGIHPYTCKQQVSRFNLRC